ncbi:hypothetical protein OROMI_027859 [Orobanche minor]
MKSDLATGGVKKLHHFRPVTVALLKFRSYHELTEKKEIRSGHRRSKEAAPLPSRHRRPTSIQKLSRIYRKMEWEVRISAGMSNSVTTAIRASVRDMAIGKARTTDKSDRATVEQAIDPRTRRILSKMHNQGEYDNINGCISTGKEANVYHATKSDGQELAIKIYKTSVLVFKISSYIPKTLDDVMNAEEDVTRLTSGQDTGDMYSKTITGLNQASSLSSSEKPNYCHLESSEEEEEVDCCASLLNEAKTAVDKKAARKENKKKVKQEKRVARETKYRKL